MTVYIMHDAHALAKAKMMIPSTTEATTVVKLSAAIYYSDC